jgi:hypothetical protein
MQMGRNSDVKYKGLVVHIQTEDLGLTAKKAMAQIFHSGQIIESRSMSYIRKFLESFHRDCFKRLQSGAYDAKLPIREEKSAPPPLAAMLDEMPAHVLFGDMAAEISEHDGSEGTASWRAVNQDPFFAESTASPAIVALQVPAFRGWGSSTVEVDRELGAALAALISR